VHALDWISADEISETAKNTAVAGAEAGDGDQHSQNLLQILYDQYVAGLKIPPAPVSQNASPQKTHGSPRVAIHFIHPPTIDLPTKQLL
jgi:hypothetical protein